MDDLSDAATAIGAVNTVVKGADGRLFGDNTDWIGIHSLVAAALREQRGGEEGGEGGELAAADMAGKTGLVVGAGGTALAAAYCVQQLGMRLVVHNRTHAKAQAVAERFGGVALASFVCPLL